MTMSEKRNGLTEAQEERLTLLIEECSEVIKCATKIQRFGYDSINPYSPHEGTNLHQLQLEMGDIVAVQRLMAINGDYFPQAVESRANEKYLKLQKYLTHQHNF